MQCEVYFKRGFSHLILRGSIEAETSMSAFEKACKNLTKEDYHACKAFFVVNTKNIMDHRGFCSDKDLKKRFIKTHSIKALILIDMEKLSKDGQL